MESPKRRIMVHGFRATAWFGSPAERKRFEANEARRVGVRETETTEPSPEFHLSIEDATVLDRATARDDVAHGTGGDASSVKPAVEVVP